MNTKVPCISVIIHTYNEEANILSCLESVKWANEIVLIDMYSTDQTTKLAKIYTSNIYSFENKGYADPARQFGLSKVSNEWVLVVDADELVPKALADKLKELATADAADIIQIPRRNFFFGHELKGTGWGSLQDHQNRFFKKSMVHYSNTIHQFFHFSPTARWITLQDEITCFYHFNYLDIDHFLTKLNTYTTIEARHMMNNEKPIQQQGILRLLFIEFKNRYIKEKGYKDGRLGLWLCCLMAFYRWVSGIKFQLMKTLNTPYPSQSIDKKYAAIKATILNEYTLAKRK